MSQPKQLNAEIPAEAAQIIDQFIGNLKMDGMRGADVAVLLIAVQTINKALAKPVSDTP